MKFKKEMLQDLSYDDCPDAEKIEETIIDKTRWSIIYKMIFKFEDKFYLSTYKVGATEQQDECPYEYDSDEIECQEVKAQEVTTIKWVPIK